MVKPDGAANIKFIRGNEFQCPTDLRQNERLNRFFGNQLGEEELAEFEDHLGDCETCRSELETRTANAKSWAAACESLMAMNDGQLETGESHFDESSASLDASRLVIRHLAPSDDPQMLGRLGAYEISGVVGQGGMGVVLKAHDPSLSRTVAIKVLSPHLAVSGAARRRFSREARAAATVTHENVVPIHGVDESGDLPFLVMPYLKGDSLEGRIKKHGPLSILSIVRIGMQISAGLAAAHQQGLVHRDIKPANIILEDGVERLLITDFGLARAVDDASLTRTGVISGTPEYMSPEQARGDAIGMQSDLFSLGSLMYSMCVGHSPFRARSSYGVMRRITDEEPRSIRETNENVPQWLEAFIFKLLRKRPEDRFESAKHSAELLRQCLAHVQHPTAAELPRQVESLVRQEPNTLSKTLIVSGLVSLFVGLAATVAIVGNSFFVGSEKTTPVTLKKLANPKDGNSPVLGEVGETTGKISQGEIAEAITLSKASAGVGESSSFLPSDTGVWISFPDFARTKKQFESTKIGELLNQDSLKPYINSIGPAFKNWLGDSELGLGLEIFDNTDWIDGEVCFAFSSGVADLRKPETHRVVLVQTKEGKATADYLKAVFKKAELKGVRNLLPGGSVVQWSFPRPKTKPRKIYQATQNGWLVVSDHRPTLDHALTMIVAGKKLPAVATLAKSKAFESAMTSTEFKKDLAGHPGDVQWFVNPIEAVPIIGQLTEGRDWTPTKNALKIAGFDTFSGVGGRIRFGTENCELVHRTFILDGLSKKSTTSQASAVRLFNFNHVGRKKLLPPSWVPNDAIRCTVFDWDSSMALANLSPIYDAFIGERGSFQRLCSDFKMDPDLKLDLTRFAANFDRRMVLFTLPITKGKTAETQTVFSVKIGGDPKYVMDVVKRLNVGHVVRVLEHEVIEFSSNRGTDELEGMKAGEFEAGLVDGGAKAMGDAGKKAADKPSKNYCVHVDGHLIYTQDKEVLKRMLGKVKRDQLSDSDGFVEVNEVLSRLCDRENVGVRHFARMNKAFEHQYERLRKGELALSDILIPMPFGIGGNDLPPEGTLPAPKIGLLERFDAKTLPADFEKHVAPFLGKSGWALETEFDGWLIHGCILKK
ncbi:MAG: protein kinase [Mariniblastus sp.]